MAEIPMLKYDVKRINEDISIESALSFYAGVTIGDNKKKIHCPSPNHVDKNASANVYQKTNTCYCFSCNKNFTPISLAIEYNPVLKFQEVCEKVIQDFGLNPYEYSNLREVELAKDCKSQNKFYDCFPLSDNELKTIGIFGNSETITPKYSIEAREYFATTDEKILKNLDIYDKNGKDIIFDCTLNELGQAGIVERNKTEEEEITTVSIREFWKEDKEGIEQMFINKCYDKIEEFTDYNRVLLKEIKDYKEKHSVEDIKQTDSLRIQYHEKFRENLFNSSSRESTEQLMKLTEQQMELTEQQKIEINSLTDFEHTKFLQRECAKIIDKTEKILKKLKSHQRDRKKQRFRNVGKREKLELCQE